MVVADSGNVDRDLARFNLLGGFRVVVGGVAIDDSRWRSRRSRNLIQWLALAPGHRISRDVVVAAFWPNLATKLASNNLDFVIANVRAAFPARTQRDPAWVVLEEGFVHLRPPMALWVDLEHFEETLQAARQSGDVDDYTRALTFYTGDLLPEETYEEWATECRGQVRATFLTAAVDLAHMFEQRGEPTRAIATLERALAVDPTFSAGLSRLARLRDAPHHESATPTRVMAPEPVPITVLPPVPEPPRPPPELGNLVVPRRATTPTSPPPPNAPPAPEQEAAHVYEQVKQAVTFAEQAAPKLLGADQADWLQRLDDRHDDFRAALRWSLSVGDVAIGLRLGRLLWRFWLLRGYVSEGRRRLTALLLAARPLGRTTDRAQALHGAAMLAFTQADFVAVRTLAGECLGIGRASSDLAIEAAALDILGATYRQQGDFATARRCHEQTVEILRSLGDERGAAMATNNLGLVATALGDLPAARAQFQHALTTLRQQQDLAGLAEVLTNLGMTADVQDTHHARAWLIEGLAIARKLGHPIGVARAMSGLARLTHAQGGYDAARGLHEHTLKVCHDVGDRCGIADTLDALAHLCHEQGQVERALILAGAASRQRETIGAIAPNRRTPLDARLDAARRSSRGDAMTSAWSRGQRMTPSQAVEFALAR